MVAIVAEASGDSASRGDNTTLGCEDLIGGLELSLEVKDVWTKVELLLFIDHLYQRVIACLHHPCPPPCLGI